MDAALADAPAGLKRYRQPATQRFIPHLSNPEPLPDTMWMQNCVAIPDEQFESRIVRYALDEQISFAPSRVILPTRTYRNYGTFIADSAATPGR
jgi:hypothetical protein